MKQIKLALLFIFSLVSFECMGQTKTPTIHKPLKHEKVVDSLLDEGRNYFGKDTKHYLPLLEQRIIKASNSAGKFQNEFLLCDEAIQIRTANRLLDG